jgi:TolA-binding protein
MKRLVVGFGMVALVLFLSTGCDKTPDKTLMNKATKLEQQEKFADAVKIFEKLVKKYPKSPLAVESLQHLANIYAYGLQDFGKAISAYERMIPLAVHSPDSTKIAAQGQFMIGYVYNNSLQDTAKARAAYTAFLAKYPKHELAESVRWELKYLGKNINDIPELNKATGQEKATPKKKKKN